ncbi:hypothetical protein M501DRAFT_1008818 [Patellaria atrata CBS 101060]|uniref:Complex I intermediate-associated protein 84 n=1 Tax=Patellaria atrata CBS 101060 TaxID=1346257 RepID=A0A9P4S2T3_9PEZI|nr:hypothetical protein M501DRAFT_1008818 [Patellaria atrata CBS 101060]
MPSQLTRLVFRHLLTSQPIYYRGCLYHLPSVAATGSSRSKLHAPIQQRSLWILSKKPKRPIRDADLDPGLQQILEFSHMERIRARLPPPEKIAISWEKFFKAKEGEKRAILDFQAASLYRAYLYLSKSELVAEKPWIRTECLSTAMSVLSRRPRNRSRAHEDLVTTIYNDCMARPDIVSYEKQIFGNYIIALSHLGATSKALELVNKEKEFIQKYNVGEQTYKQLLYGFSEEGNDTDVLEIADDLARNGLFSRKHQRVLVTHFYEKGDLDKVKYWYTKLTDGEPDEYTVKSALKACLAANDLTWGRSIIEDLTQRPLTKPLWDTLLIWAAGTGKGVEELDRIMNVMVRTNKNIGRPDENPDIVTINGLVEFAISKKDPYLAERCTILGQKWNIHPNAQTFILQMQYRISVGDIDGALAAYRKLRAEEVHEDLDGPITNQLIQAMCVPGRYRFTSIMEVVEDVNERKMRFEPDTVSALCVLHLKRDELHDVIDLIQTHAFHFSLEERSKVRDVFVDFCLDPAINTALLWDTYMIFHQLFEETGRDIRMQIMEEFFRRKKGDMAFHVFNHMRQHSRPDTRANRDTYIKALEGMGRAKDIDNLELLNNQLKLDFEIEPDTRLNNALMIAYIACGEPRRAYAFWDQIINSREGPSFNSLKIMFMACEKAPFGEDRAKPVWERIRQMDIDISSDILASYVGALAGNHLHEEVKAFVDAIEDEFGTQPDLKILGTCYNATRSNNQKKGVEEWIKEKYPHVWDEMEATGFKVTTEGTREVKIDRRLTA